MKNKLLLIAASPDSYEGPIFKWRNHFRSPLNVEDQSNVPLSIRNPKFYSY